MIGDCIESVWWGDEIIVVDMHSTDATAQICGAYPNVRLFEREDYIFGNVTFGSDQARGHWTLSLDSDERIAADLALATQAVLRCLPPDVIGFYFNQIAMV
jgi:glycosyltransferase involved in cell wall biosynthesis